MCIHTSSIMLPTLFLTIFLLGNTLTECSHILLLSPFCSRSHKNSIDPAISELVSRGHKITEVAMYVNSNSTAIHQYELKAMATDFLKEIPNPFQPAVQHNIFLILNTKISELIRLTFDDPVFQQFLKDSENEKYDVIIVNSFINEFILPVAHRFGAPIIYWNPGNMSPYLAWTFNVPFPSSYVTSVMVQYKAPLTYLQRFSNLAINLAITLGRNYILVPKIESIMREFVPDSPPLLDIERNVSLILVNTHISMEGARPIMPNVINVGAMHCRPSKPISKELESFIFKSGDEGFILFSLGSVVRGDHMPQWIVDIFLTVFGKLKQQVIWKFESQFEKTPPNVLVSKWLPQQDLLGHPKCRLAILHGGLNGLQEAIYHGVPVLGMPLGADRDSNLAKFVKDGVAEVLDWTTMTEEILSAKMDKLLNDPKYRDKARTLSSQLRDNLDTPKATAAFWIEYVIRNKGAHHLKSLAGQLYFFQYFMLDVLAVIVLILLTGTLITVWVSKRTIRLCFRSLRKRNKAKTS